MGGRKVVKQNYPKQKLAPYKARKYFVSKSHTNTRIVPLVVGIDLVHVHVELTIIIETEVELTRNCKENYLDHHTFIILLCS